MGQGHRYLGLAGWLGLNAFLPGLGLAFSVVAPTEGQVVTPGQTLAVAVELGSELGVRQVQYFWYGEQQEPPGARQATPDHVATASSEPPYGGRLVVPVTAVGTIRLLAVAEVTGGRLGTREDFDEVVVRAEPKAGIRRIEFEAEKPWRFDTIGRLVTIPVVAVFEDGVHRDIRGSSAGSTFTSSDERVVRAYPNGLLRVIGNGRASITVTNRGVVGTLPVVVAADGEPNEWPQADAGPDVHVKAGETVILSGIMSMDPDGDPLRYQWRQLRGKRVSLLDSHTAKAKFVAPLVSAERLLQFELRVTDMEGADRLKGADSLPSVVDVWVQP